MTLQDDGGSSDTGSVNARAGFRTDQQRRGLSLRTIQDRENVLNRLGRWADLPLLVLTREHLEAWLDTCDLEDDSRAAYISILHCFYEYAQLEGYRDDDPTLRIRRPKVRRRVPRPIGDGELDEAIHNASPMLRSWLCLAAYSGFRCKEIAGLRREDILDYRTPAVVRVVDGKGGHEAVIPLHAEVLRSLRAYGLPGRGHVFRNAEGRPFRAQRVSAIGNEYLHRLGIPETMHQLRHWFGTSVWAESKDLRVTQEMLRHADPSMAAKYAAYDHDLAVAAVTQLRVKKP